MTDCGCAAAKGSSCHEKVPGSFNQKFIDDVTMSKTDETCEATSLTWDVTSIMSDVMSDATCEATPITSDVTSTTWDASSSSDANCVVCNVQEQML